MLDGTDDLDTGPEAAPPRHDPDTDVGLVLSQATDGDRATVRCDGVLDIATVNRLRELLNGLVVDGHVHLVVDLDGVRFIDSTGLTALVGARRRTHALKGTLTIVCTNPRPLRLLEMTGLTKVFEVVESVPADAPQIG